MPSTRSPVRVGGVAVAAVAVLGAPTAYLLWVLTALFAQWALGVSDPGAIATGGLAAVAGLVGAVVAANAVRVRLDGVDQLVRGSPARVRVRFAVLAVGCLAWVLAVVGMAVGTLRIGLVDGNLGAIAASLAFAAFVALALARAAGAFVDGLRRPGAGAGEGSRSGLVTLLPAAGAAVVLVLALALVVAELVRFWQAAGEPLALLVALGVAGWLAVLLARSATELRAGVADAADEGA